jgi:hypothetical protein
MTVEGNLDLAVAFGAAALAIVVCLPRQAMTIFLVSSLSVFATMGLLGVL